MDTLDSETCPEGYCFAAWAFSPNEAIRLRYFKQFFYPLLKEADLDKLSITRTFGIDAIRDAYQHYRLCSDCNPDYKGEVVKPPVVRYFPRYFITMTIDPKKRMIPYDEFKTLVEEQLSRKTFSKVFYAIEHVWDGNPANWTNMHAHCLITSDVHLSKADKQWYHLVKHVGYVDQKVVRKDNGVSAYMTKERPMFERINGPNGFEFHQI